MSELYAFAVLALMFSLLLGQRVRDTLCGTKVIWACDYPKLMAARDYFDSCDSWGEIPIT